MLQKAVVSNYKAFIRDVEREDMGVGAQQKLTMVTALQSIVTVLFLFACFVLRDWHGDMKVVQDKQGSDHEEISILKSSMGELKKSVEKMDDKLDILVGVREGSWRQREKTTNRESH